VERQKTLVIPKVDNSLKHIGHGKCKISMLSVHAGFSYYNKDSIHAKNECA